MNLRGGKIKADLPPLKNTKKKCEQIRNSCSMPELNSIYNNSIVNIDSIPTDWSDQYCHEFCNEFENNININDKTISDLDDDEDESTAKIKSNKSNASEANTDEHADDISASEDIAGNPLVLINSTKKNSKEEYCKKLCYEGFYYVVDRDYV
jgi:hypothetical protein